LLAAKWNDSNATLFSQLHPGELALLAARPAQGKTLLGLGLAIECMERGGRAAFFTLDLSEADVARAFRALDRDLETFRDRLLLDFSDGIDADHIVRRLASAPSNMLIVVDYLQLLDQKRDAPTLPEQVVRLKRFARERRQTIVFISQINRSFDDASNECPRLTDVHLPNPLDLTLFDQACFLNRGKMQVVRAA
jgi:replicative DNA helicase